jgi:hypothetical protein
MEAIEQKAEEALASSRVPREREVRACDAMPGPKLKREFRSSWSSAFNLRLPAHNTPFSRALSPVAGAGPIFMNALVFYSAPLAQWLERWSYEP